jgi:transposase
VTYGVNFQAWCVFLMVMHHVPVKRCADIIESMAGTRPSDGWVHALLARAARAVAAANKAIRALILLARVICGDETPLRAGPGPKANKKYLQVACTSLLTCYFLGERSLPSFKGFIYSDLHGTVVVHDRYVNYDHFGGISHQLCTAHYPDTVVMPIPGGPVLAGGGARVRDIGIITGLRGRPAAGQAAGSGRAGLLAGWSGRGLAA